MGKGPSDVWQRGLPRKPPCIISAAGGMEDTFVEMGNIQRKVALEMSGLRYVECRILYWRCQMDK